jgi:LAO/AO transport system kinase
MLQNGELEKSRAAQAQAWLWSETAETLLESLKESPVIREKITELEKAVAAGKTSPWVAAHRLVKTFLQKTH